VLMGLVKPGGRPHTRVRPGCVVTTVSWKHWPCLFPQHGQDGSTRGRSRSRTGNATLSRSTPADFLRGLFHSDGSRVANWATREVAGVPKRYPYPRWQFTNHSSDIRELCCWALDLLDLPWRQSNWKTVSVSRREAVARLDGLIGLKA
jgi:hypothetical protein